MSFDMNPMDEDPHGECRHEIHRLGAENKDLLKVIQVAEDAMCQATFNLNGKNCRDLNDAIKLTRAAIASATGKAVPE